jgi:hypothetical protein
MQKKEQELYASGKAAWDEMCFEVAQLQLIAAKPVSNAAEALRLSHESLGLGLDRGNKTVKAAQRKIVESAKIEVHTEILVKEARIALGSPGSARRRMRWSSRWIRRRSGNGSASPARSRPQVTARAEGWCVTLLKSVS